MSEEKRERVTDGHRKNKPIRLSWQGSNSNPKNMNCKEEEKKNSAHVHHKHARKHLQPFPPVDHGMQTALGFASV